MVTATYRQLAKSGEAALNFHDILGFCRESHVRHLTVEQDTYHLHPDWCTQRSLSISNHGYNGPKRIGLAITDTEDLDIDFCGSTLVCHGLMTPIALVNCRNITLRNVTLRHDGLPLVELRVTSHGPDYIETENIHGMDLVRLIRGNIYTEYAQRMISYLSVNVEFDGKTGELAPGTGDNTLGVSTHDLTFCPTEDGKIRIYGGKRRPPVGNVLLFNAARRVGCGIFCQDCHTLRLENVTVNSCYGMGLLAQVCRDITLEGFCTARAGGRMGTAGADATHFVNCSGVVRVENCHFEGQLDDALNIHGMYTRIIGREDRCLLVRQMHPEATGIPIYRPGDRLHILPPDTLLPYAEKTVERVEQINDVCFRIHLQEPAEDVQAGDDVENISRNADLIFRRCTVRDNRARGMLIGTRGKVLIEDCDFHTSGTAIKFESDGDSWFESGATRDVTVRGCRFDRCKYGAWGDAVIEFTPRRATEPGRYFHGSVRIEDNRFLGGIPQVLRIDNAARLSVQGNTFARVEPAIRLSHVGELHIQDGIGEY